MTREVLFAIGFTLVLSSCFVVILSHLGAIDNSRREQAHKCQERGLVDMMSYEHNEIVCVERK